MEQSLAGKQRYLRCQCRSFIQAYFLFPAPISVRPNLPHVNELSTGGGKYFGKVESNTVLNEINIERRVMGRAPAKSNKKTLVGRGKKKADLEAMSSPIYLSVSRHQ